MVAQQIPIGISHCLLGAPVRFDGGHKHWSWCTETLTQYFSFQPICPEVESGMSIPREPIRQVERSDGIQLVATKNITHDFTEQLSRYSKNKVESLSELSGFIFMKNSPTCGLERVKVYSEATQMPQKKGIGIFARYFSEKYPLIPVEDSGRLQDAAIRENFIARVFIYHQWNTEIKPNLSSRKLIEFHSKHKFTLLAHCQSAYREAGKRLGNLKEESLETIANEYIAIMMRGLRKIASKKNHTNVLQHLIGFIKEDIEPTQKQEILGSIEEYRNGDIPLLVPITLVRHYINQYGTPYVKAQSYWQPHPRALKLRSSL